MFNLAIFSNHKGDINRIKEIASNLNTKINICYQGDSKSDFLEKLKSGLKIDIIISEVFLDHSRIFNLLKKTNDICPNVKSIAIVSKVNLNECRELMRYGVNYLVPKNWTDIEMKESLIHITKIISMQNEYIAKIEQLQNRDPTLSYAIESSLLNILVTYHSVSPEFGKRLKFENINYDKKYCLLSIIDYLPEEASLNDFKGENILKDMIAACKQLNNETLELHWFDRSNAFVILFFSDQKIDKVFLLNMFTNVLNKYRSESEKNRTKVSVSEVSDIPEGRSFRKLYRHAKRCLLYKQLERSPDVIFYEDVKVYEQNEGKVDDHEFTAISTDLTNGNLNALIKKISSLVHRSFLPKFTKSFEYIISAIVLSVYRGCPYINKEENVPSVKETIRKAINFKSENELTEYLFKLCTNFDRVNKKWRKKGVSVSYESIVNYIKTHYEESDFTVTDLCKHFNYSKTYLSEILKKHKTSFVKILNDERIENACSLITSTDFSMNDVAKKSGFNSLIVFSNKFKQIKKISPLQYKKANKKKD